MEKFVKYPIGVQDFESLIKDGFIYVDKTSILYRLINQGKYIFLSRPRRFGKSLTLSTLKAFFEGKKDLFKGLAIQNLEKEWRRHPVFLLSFARFERKIAGSLESILGSQLEAWEREYDLHPTDTNMSVRFYNVIRKAVEVTGERAVVLIDEYDSALVSTLEDQELHDHIRTLLKPVYTVLKDLDSHIRFSLITGITRFSRMTIFSGLNNIQDISLLPAYGSICGISQTELEEYFTESIKEMAVEKGISAEECLQKMKSYYDGYHFTENSEDIYNPFSILTALSHKKLGSYWFGTGIPTFIVERMRHRDIDIEKAMNPRAGETILQEADSAYTSDEAILFQAGFLTIKGYDAKRELYTLGIPNREVMEGMSRLFMEKFLMPDRIKSQNLIFDLEDAVEEGNPEKFLELLKSFLAGVPFDMSKGDKEVYYHNTFYIITNLLGLRVQVERHTSSGSIDLLITTSDYIYVIEIKLNKPAREALEQIETKEYALPWLNDSRKLFKIGISFSSESRNISEWIISQ